MKRPPDPQSDKNMGEAAPKKLRDIIATMKGRKPSNDPVEQADLDELLPISKTIKEQKESENLSNAKIGDMIEGKGVYFGTWVPKDTDGKSFGLVFNLFAAPEDITDENGKRLLLTFNDAGRHVAGLKNWHGHDGNNFANDSAVYDAIHNGNYKALKKWFIPTLDMIKGTDINGNIIQTDHLYAHKNKGFLKGTLITGHPTLSDRWYWSCTEDPEDSLQTYKVVFEKDNNRHRGPKNVHLGSTRLVRAELHLPVFKNKH